MKWTRSESGLRSLFCALVMILGFRAARAETPSAGSIWTIQSATNPRGTSYDYLSGVAAIAANDVWVVGSFGAGVPSTLVEHWNGQSWQAIASPNHPKKSGCSSSYNLLYAAAGTSTADIWAVGYYASCSPARTLIEHWDGTTWRIVPSPSPGTSFNVLYAVAAVSPSDAWAVGNYQNASGADRPLLEHWDGSTWTVVPGVNPKGSASTSLSAVTAGSSNDVWAVGASSNVQDIYPSSLTLVEHWDGNTWSVVSSPSPGKGIYQINALNAVTEVSSNDVWAVGWYSDASSNADETLIEHWDGSAWHLIPSPNVTTAAGTMNILNSVAAFSSGDIWAVGSWTNSTYLSKTLTLRWNGSNWKIAPSPSRSDSSYLNGLAVVSPNDAWAVGSSNTGGVVQILVLFTPQA